jgi:anti-sigma regulatory factor (Ser/Thr protein kinase)
MEQVNDEQQTRIVADDEHKLLRRKDLFFKKFPSDYRQVRYFALLIAQKAPPEIKEINLLEQQICELLKNAIKHGNKNDSAKEVSVWFNFSPEHAHIIVEDEGDGFKDLEEWNEFNRRRLECLHTENFEALADYVSYRTEKSDPDDGGNALFAALEYWNGGIVFNGKRNAIAVYKKFPKRRFGVHLDELDRN